MAIVILGDNEDFNKVLSEVSDRINQDLEFIENYEDYDKYSEGNTPELLVINSAITGRDPYDFCKALRRGTDSSNLPVIFTVDNIGDIDKKGFYQSGGTDFITKPFVPEEIFFKISSIINRNRHIRNLRILADIDRVIRKESDIKISLRQILDLVLEIFKCDRAWLMHLCDPNGKTWIVPVERTGTQFPAMFKPDEEVEMTRDLAEILDLALNLDQPVYDNLKGNLEFDSDGKLSIKSYMLRAVYPESGKPWVFGIHQCSRIRAWLDEDKKLFNEIAAKIEDALSRIILYRDLELSEKKYRDVFENITDIYVETGFDGTIFEVSPSIERMMGYKIEELVGNSVIQYYADLSQREHIVNSIREKGEILDYSTSFILKDGSIGTFSLTSYLERDSHGNPYRMKTILRNISEREKAEKELADTNILLESVIEKSPVPIVLTDAVAKTIKRYNSAAATILGLSEENDTTGRNIYNILPEEQPYKHLYPDGSPMGFYDHPAFKAMDGEYTNNMELIIERVNGSRKWVMISAIPIYNDKKEIIAVLSIFPDITDLKELQFELESAEKKYRKSEELLRSLFDNSPVGLALFDREYRYVMINEKAASYNKIPASMREGRKVEEVISPKAAAYVINNLNTVLKSGESHKIEFSWTPGESDKDIRSVAIYHFPVKDESGEVNNVGAILIDTTDMKNAERKILDSENRLKAIFDNVPVGLALYDSQCRYVMLNKALSKIDGISIDNHIGKSLMELFPERGVLGTKYIDTVFKSGEPMRDIDFSSELGDRKGELTHLILSYFPVFNEEHDVVLVGISAVDISELISLKNISIRREAKLQAVYKSAPIGIGLVIERIFHQINKRFCEMTGYPKEELLGKSVLMLYPEKIEFDSVGQKMDKLINSYGIGTVETSFRRKDGKIINVMLSLTPLNKSNYLEGMVFTALDVTGQKKAEDKTKRLQDQLSQAQKMESVGRLAGGVAHDFNNMLNVILGHVDMALLKLSEDDPMQKRFIEIQKAAMRSADLTRQLLAFSRNQSVLPEVMDVNEKIKNMLKFLKRLIGEDIEFIWQGSEKIHCIEMDPAQLDQIIVNLIVNARDSIKSTGRITVETENVLLQKDYFIDEPDLVEGEYVMITITDTGMGMDRETQGKIFEPFFTTKKIGEGTGLGLATVFGIVKQNMGFIKVYSERGYGSAFRVYLPVCESDKNFPGEISEPEKAQVKGGDETILMVEDESSILDLAVEMLRELGYNVFSSSSPADALTLTKDHSGDIDLLITDVIMPGMNGRDLSIKLSSLYPDIKTLFISGYTANIITRQGVVDMGAKFLQKPFTKYSLASKIREVLD